MVHKVPSQLTITANKLNYKLAELLFAELVTGLIAIILKIV